MATGQDKVISYDPPGAIGLLDENPIFLIRFDETDQDSHPQDAGKVCDDFGTLIEFDGNDFPSVQPQLVPAVLGRGRMFDGASTGLTSRDRESGATLLTRDMSIQVVMRWEASVSSSATGTIVARGLGAVSTEISCFRLQIDFVSTNADTSTGLLRWVWDDVAGAQKIQSGSQVTLKNGCFTMLTATRRWVSPTRVVISYYVGDLLLGSFESADGSIGGATTGTMQIGFNGVGDDGSTENFLAGTIDEILIVDREMCLEEVEATWLRLTKYQPLGTQLLLQNIDKGFPLPTDPSSEAQLDIRFRGQVLGFASAQAENLRANFLPQRSYGHTLEQWEEALAVARAPLRGIQERRDRILARLRQRLGVSIPGLRQALFQVMDGGVDFLQFLAASNIIRDDFSSPLSPLRWWVDGNSGWESDSGHARMLGSNGIGIFTGAARLWRTAAMMAGGRGREAHLRSSITMPSPVNGLETGLYFSDDGYGNFLLLGLRDNAGSFEIITERFLGWISQGVTVQVTLGGNPSALWLHLYQTTVAGTWKAAWSQTSATEGYTTSADITHPSSVIWAGLYARGIGAAVSTGEVRADDFVLYCPFGTRPFNAYVLLDRTLGFHPDIAGARSVVQTIRHGYTHATFITSRAMLCDDIDSGCDLVPMGAI